VETAAPDEPSVSAGVPHGSLFALIFTDQSPKSQCGNVEHLVYYHGLLGVGHTRVVGNHLPAWGPVVTPDPA